MSARASAERLYRVLLLAYPAEFRREYGAEAARVFARLHADARLSGRGSRLTLWRRTVPQVVLSGISERIGGGRGHRSRAAASGGGPVDPLRQDVRLALRSIRRRPGFALTAILLIALGVGATTLMFSVVDAVVLSPLPYPGSERLHRLTREGSALSFPDYADVQTNVAAFDATAAAWWQSMDLTGGGEPERLWGALASGELFEVLGARALRGRLFTSADLSSGAPRLAVITSGLWVRRFGGDPAILGRTIQLNGEPAEVIGVLDPSFLPPEGLNLADVEVYLPVDLAQPDVQNRHMMVLSVVARRAPGVTVAAAEAELGALSTRLAEMHPDTWRSRRGDPLSFTMRSLKESTIDDVGRTLWMLLGAVGLMLLIACANVANLFLARATEREQEMAVRAALGAGRGRIVTQVLTEGLLLALLGGLAGVAFAHFGLHVFRLLDPGGIPRFAEVTVDVRVVAFAVLVSAISGILFALAPAWSASRSDAGSVLRETGLRATATRSRSRLRNALVVAELALALVLLAGAGVLFHGFVRLRGVDPGFRPENLLTIQLDASSAVPPAQRAFFVRELMQRITEQPGVRAVGLSWRLPFDRGRCCWNIRVTDAAGPADTAQAMIHPVTTGYLAALGGRVVEGRWFTDADQDAGRIPGPMEEGAWPARLPVVVNRALAERLWAGQPAVGKLLRAAREAGDLEVIGVIEPVRHWALSVEASPDAYLPFDAVAHWRLGLLDIGVRHDGNTGPIVAAARSALRSMAPDLPISRMAEMEDRISGSIATPRFYAALLSTFALLAFLLAAAGVYGSMLYMVGMRRREMGIRLALGAEAGAIVRLVLRRGALLVLAGTLFGLASASAAIRALRSIASDVSGTDSRPLILAAALLALTGLLACWLPARRAARADAVAMLRSE